MLLVSLVFEEIVIGSAALRKAPTLADLYNHNLLHTQVCLGFLLPTSHKVPQTMRRRKLESVSTEACWIWMPLFVAC
jgi:hypothetical protein